MRLTPSLLGAICACALSLCPPVSAQVAGERVIAPQTIQLLLSGDVDQLSVREAIARPWPYLEPRREQGARGRIDLLGADGRLVHRVPFELAHFNLYRDHRKGQTLVYGDHVHVPDIDVLVKIPDMGARVAELRIDLRDSLRTRTLGRISMSELRKKMAQSSASPLAAPKVTTVVDNGPVANRYDIVILGDGYQASEEARFYSDIDRWRKDLFGREPFKSYERFFNVHAVFRASIESGADQPDVSPPIVKNTAYDATYNYSGTARCLYIKNRTLATSDAKLAPDVEGRVVVFVNSSRYGGCAGTFAVSYNGSSGPVVQSHEFGHSFGGLADEYDYGRSGTYSGSEPSQANITADPTGKAKWPLWLGYNGIGAYQGAGYYKTGLYRPKNNCLMRSLSAPLCEICIEQLCKKGYETVTPIENALPAGVFVGVNQSATQLFSFDNLVPDGGKVEWYVDNQLVQTGGSQFVLASAAYPLGFRVVELRVTDETDKVRKDPSKLLYNKRNWTVSIGAATSQPIGTVPTGMAQSEGNARVTELFEESPGRVQFLYRKSDLPASSGSRTLQGLRLRPDAGAASEFWEGELEVQLSSVGVAVGAPSSSSFKANHGSDVRVAFARKSILFPALRPGTAPHPFVMGVKFDSPQVLSGAQLCVDFAGWTPGYEQRTWALDAQADQDFGSATSYGTGCPSNASYSSKGHYVGGLWETSGSTQQAPSATSFALAWIGSGRQALTFPGSNCTLLADVLAFHGVAQLTQGTQGFARFVWGPVPPGLQGLKITSQMLGVDASFAPTGLRLTHALEIQIGAGYSRHTVAGSATATQSFDPSKDVPQRVRQGAAAVLEIY
jgi:hypothetical protein